MIYASSQATVVEHYYVQNAKCLVRVNVTNFAFCL